jgi:hypothetical protein
MAASWRVRAVDSSETDRGDDSIRRQLVACPARLALSFALLVLRMPTAEASVAGGLLRDRATRFEPPVAQRAFGAVLSVAESARQATGIEGF